jgi:hypothetical protein
MTTVSIGQRLQAFSPIAHAPRMPPAVSRLPRQLAAKTPPVTIATASVRALAGDDAAGTAFFPSLPVLAPGAHLDVHA